MADNYSFKDASGSTITHASEEISAGVHASKHVDVDDAGVAIAKAEDVAHVSGDKGVMALAVRKDSAAAVAGTDGDYTPLITDSSGRLHVVAASNPSAGDVAHDAADSGNPIKIGGKARTAIPAAVANGDRVDAYFDEYGRLAVNSVGYTWGYVSGYSTGYIDGDTTDWWAVRASTDDDPSDVLSSAANVLKYFDSDEAAFDTTPIWVKVPIWGAAAGWATWWANIYNNLGVSLRIDVYGVFEKGTLTGSTKPISQGTSYCSIATAIDIPHASGAVIGPGGTSFTTPSMWPVGWLAIKATPASDPAAGKNWALTLARGR